jgi:hypothetical protein
MTRLGLHIIMAIGLSVSFQALGQAYETGPEDTLTYLAVSGEVVDARSGNPIIFANIFLKGTNIGTVSNSDGHFILKVPLFIENKTLVVSSIGYKNIELGLGHKDQGDHTIELEPRPIPIDEVTIINRDARELILSALDKIPENYSRNPFMVTSFYRETIKQNRHYVAVSEAILDGYKGAYTNPADFDRIKIFKGRKSRDVRRMDTVLFKLQGGPRSMFMLDIVKNPLDLFDRKVMNYYVYQMGGVVNIDDRQAYVVEFNQLENIDYPLYSGRIYIDVLSHAIAGTEFRISPEKLDDAAQYLVRKKPIGMRIELLNANYLVSYRFTEDHWYLNHVRTELIMAVRWKKRLFRSTYTTTSEMAVTDLDRENITRYRFRESTNRGDIFIDQVEDFEDPDFWGEYNIIQPEESIEAAIERIARMLKRRSD